MDQIFPHQAMAYRELRRTADAFFSKSWQNFPVRPRFNRLLVGASGTGKTHLARNLARDLNVPYLELCATNWIPLGANERGARPSWLDVADFCYAHPRGIICIDEIDKCGDRTPWMTYVRVEVFLLLDHRFPGNMDWQPRDPEFDEEDRPKARALSAGRLHDSVLVLGAGAFHDLWGYCRTPAGFHANETSGPRHLSSQMMAEVIPVEILNRFAPPLIAMPPLVRTDYLHLLDALCGRFPEVDRAGLRALAVRTLDNAVSQQLGARWAEQLVLEMLTADNAAPDLLGELKKAEGRLSLNNRRAHPSD
jgi:hypothetical protein